MIDKNYDAIIIGAGMSGLAAGIRLAMFDKRVCILEKHFAPGGLNSFYRRGSRYFDVGLHSLTNYDAFSKRTSPLGKILKSLRIKREELKLSEQLSSQIILGETSLTFENDFNTLTSEIYQKFPKEIDGFIRLIEKIKSTDRFSVEPEAFTSAREVVSSFITNPLLEDMIFFPILAYGSATENDLDFKQFAIIFSSIFMEGLSRPEGGIRPVLELLLNKFRENGGELRLNTGVRQIQISNDKIQGVILNSGELIRSKIILSSAGLPETYSLLEGKTIESKIGNLSIAETILVSKIKPKDLGVKSTIVFYNKYPSFKYQRPKDFIDNNSAIISFPNNFQKDDFDEGIFRLTVLANYQLWKTLDRKSYLKQKEQVAASAKDTLKGVNPKLNFKVAFKDVFTPLTIKKFTGRKNGAIYGSPHKVKNGLTPIQGLYICGTDQGFLGVTGAMLSGITIANIYGLQN